jgi:TolA-binding protein
MLYRKFLRFLMLFVLTGTQLSAQKTELFNDNVESYRIGTELFQQNQYGSAMKQFNQFIRFVDEQQDRLKYHEYYIDALYYRARCSNELDQPQAENYFLDLVDDYELTPVTRMTYYYLGNIYYKQRKYDRAITYFSQLKVADLNQTQLNEYRFQLGYCYFFRKKFDKAEALFNIIKETQNKYYYPANYYYGYIAYYRGNYAEAEKSFNRIADTKLFGPVVPYYTASIAYHQSKYEDAISLANLALENDKLKYRDELKLLIGKSYFSLGDYQKALPYLKEYYDKVSKANKDDIYQIGYCQYKLQQYESAAKSLSNLSTLKDSLGQNALYIMGDCYLKLNQKANARNAFLELLKIDGDPIIRAEAQFYVARLNYDLGFNDQAAATMQDFIIKHPRSSHIDEAREILTQIFLSTNNYRDALQVIQRIENPSASTKQAYQKVAYGRGIQLYNDKAYTDALKIFEVSLNNPIDLSIQALCYFWKGECFYALKKYTEANLNYFKYLETAKVVQQKSLNTSPAAANYGIGYAYLKKNEYNKAVTYFDHCLNELQSKNSYNKDDKPYYDRIYPDCLLRSGDCYFAIKNYSKARTSYSSVINKKFPGTDYALFQRAMLYGLEGRLNDKISDLETLSNTYGLSPYLDDALFETGDTYLKSERYENAILVFNRIINDFPNSRYVKNAHLKLGLIYFNTNRKTNALDEYKIVASQYPKTPEAKDALDGIKEIYMSLGNADAYIGYIKSIPNSGITASQEDSVVYQTAERKYKEGQFDIALDKFSNYLNSFPKGYFSNDAHYYRASCLMMNKDYTNALTDYEYIINKNDQRYLENALLNASRIEYYEFKQYENAFNHYNRLSKTAEIPSNLLEAKLGMMRSAFILERYNEARIAAIDISGDDLAKDDAIHEAAYYQGKIAQKQNQYTDAITYYNKVFKATKNEMGAESGYRIAECYYALKNTKDAETWCYNVVEQTPSSDYWLAKSYLLLTDLFIEQGDLFNAKATLNSIIDNYKHNDDIVPAAKEKLNTVLEQENQNSKMYNPENNEELPSDNK